MATLDGLYARIILDTNRDDMAAGGELEQAKIDAVADAIEMHAGEQFWFNRASGTVPTVANTATVAPPTGVRIAQVVTYLGVPLAKVALEAIEAATNATTPATGPPDKWAEDDGLIRLYPTPNAVYSLAVYGIAELGVPATGGASNEWTVQGYQLILNEAKATLCRGPLRDADGLALAKDGRNEALTKLRRETRRRGVTPARTDIPRISRGYDIRSG